MAKTKSTRGDVRLGSTGPDVAEVRELLARAGVSIPFALSVCTPELAQAIAYFQSTHLDRKGKPLLVDGWCGETTWWALDHAVGSAQTLGIVKHIPDGLSEDRRQLLELAHGYHGVAEKPLGSNRGLEIDVWTGFGAVAPSRKGPAWCSFFASGIWHELLERYPLGGRIGSCYAAKQLAVKREIYVPNVLDVEGVETKRVELPTPGDQGVMLFPLAVGGEHHGHTFFISSVSQDGKWLGTIEGNCANRVARRVRDIGTLDGWITVLPPSEYKRGLPPGLKFVGSNETTR